MLTLSLESSAKAASVALSEDGRLIAEYFQNCGLTHSSTLLPMAEDMLKNSGRTLAELDLVAVATGPGSFTGIRIGVATAKGLCWALEKPAAGVSTLAAIACGAAEAVGDGVICAVMDARRRQFYNAVFEVRGGTAIRLCEDRAIDIEELVALAKADGRVWTLAGDGAELCRRLFEEAGVEHRLAPKSVLLQRASGVAIAAQAVQSVDAAELVPTYLRLSQAERERLEREKNNAK